MKRTILWATMAAVLAGAPVAANATTRNGDGNKFLTFANANAACDPAGSPVAQPVVEPMTGVENTVTSTDVIVSITIKSGSKVTYASSQASWSDDGHSVTVRLTQDWSNYAITTCTPAPTDGGGDTGGGIV